MSTHLVYSITAQETRLHNMYKVMRTYESRVGIRNLVYFIAI